MTSSGSERSRRWAEANPMSVKATRLKQYGLSLDEYFQMLEEQGDVCLLCQKPESAKSPKSDKIKALSVDHDHATGKVRALLCHRCNVDVGKVEKLIGENRMTKIIEYISGHLTYTV